MMQAVRSGVLVAGVWLVACVGATNPDNGSPNGGTGGRAAAGNGGQAAGKGGTPALAGSVAGGSGGAGGSPDAAGSDGGVDAGSVPADGVPMFVASGYAGRTITSCDDGRTWIANHQYENANNDHSPYTGKGLTYGDGTFMAMMAWGADGSIKVSEDGVEWRRETNIQKTFYGGIAFGGGVFATLRQNSVQLSRDRGKTWTRAMVQPGGDFREGGGGSATEGVFGGGSNGLQMSWDGGNTWRAASGCTDVTLGGIGQRGGVAYQNGTLLFVGENGRVCAVSNKGATFTNGALGATVAGKVFVAGGKFWVPNGARARISADGLTWEDRAFTPAGTSFHAVAQGASGTYVGVAHEGRFFRSTDGVAWERATGPEGGPTLLRVVAGLGRRSAKCP